MAGNVISRARKAYTLADYPSGQRGLTVNQLALPSQVRILYLPRIIENLNPRANPWVQVFPVVSVGLATHFKRRDRKSTRLNSSHVSISYAVFCLKKKRISTSPS